MSMARKLRTLLREKKFIVTMAIETPVHAMIVEKAGFDFAYVGGYDVSLALLGLPDVGLITETEMVAKEFAWIACDMVFCEFPSADVEYPKKFAQEIHQAYPGLPLYFNYSSNLKWHEFPLTTFENLADMGYKAMHVSQACLRPSMQAVWDYAVDLKARGAQAEIDLATL